METLNPLVGIIDFAKVEPIRKETGITTLNYIHQHLIDRAKTELATTQLTVSEIAYQLGFQYSQHFTRLFKNKVGMTPIEYRLQVG